MQKYFFIRTDGKFVKISYDAIVFIEGSRNYTKIITENKSYLVLITMKKMEQLLPSFLFKRIHRSFIVSLDKVLEFDKETVCLKDRELPVGHQYRNELEKAFLIINDTGNKKNTEKSQARMQVIINSRQPGKLVSTG